MTHALEQMGLETLPKSAVFVDLENMAIGNDAAKLKGEYEGISFDISRVMKKVQELTNPVLRRSYADWVKMSRYRHFFLHHGFDQVQTTYVNSTKNGADMQMCVDAMEVVLLNSDIELFFLITADSDFSALARAIRRHGRRVIGIGWREKANAVFRRHCDAFIAYESLPGPSIDDAQRPRRPRTDHRRGIAQGGRVAATQRYGQSRPAALGGLIEAFDGDAARAVDDLLYDPRDMPAMAVPSPRPTPSATLPRPMSEADAAIAQLVAQHGPGARISGAQFGLEIRNVDPAFDHADFGVTKLSEFVDEHPLLRREASAEGSDIHIVLPGRDELDAELASENDGAAADDAETAAPLLAALGQPPIGFLGGAMQSAVLATLHRRLCVRHDVCSRQDLIRDVAGQLRLRQSDVSAVERLLWNAKVYVVEERAEGQRAMHWKLRLNERYRDFDGFRHAHDRQLIAVACDHGVLLTPAQWSELLYRHDGRAEEMAEHLDELGRPAVAADMLAGGDAPALAAVDASRCESLAGAAPDRHEALAVDGDAAVLDFDGGDSAEDGEPADPDEALDDEADLPLEEDDDVAGLDGDDLEPDEDGYDDADAGADDDADADGDVAADAFEPAGSAAGPSAAQTVRLVARPRGFGMIDILAPDPRDEVGDEAEDEAGGDARNDSPEPADDIFGGDPRDHGADDGDDDTFGHMTGASRRRG